MIIVTGAAGQLGRGVVEGLLRRAAAGDIVASVRDPARAGDFAAAGVEVRRGDFSHPEGLAAAFKGADQVLVVSVDKLGEEGRRLHRTAIAAAQASGAARVLYTSHMGTRADSPLADHLDAEAALAEGDTPWTSLRHGFYAESAFFMIGRGLEAGEIRAPEDGPVSWTARADLAEADAAILAGGAAYEGLSPPLTASRAYTLEEFAAAASEIAGREIRRVTLTDEAWLDEKVAAGAPPAMAEVLLGMWRCARRGDYAAVDPTLETLIGRRPLTLSDILAERLSAGPAA